MSPERSNSPLSPRAATPRVVAAATNNVAGNNVEEAAVAANGRCSNGDADDNAQQINQTAADDDLTSLTWLQDKNLLKGMNLNKTETDDLSANSLENKDSLDLQDFSPTSDYVDESSTSAADSSSSSLNSPIPHSNNFTPRQKHPPHVAYNPRLHVNSKPPFSFSCLIFMAIDNSERKALPVKEIYAWILENFPYFNNAPTGWKNSVRHNLSLNKCFLKVEKASSLGKGSLWTVDPHYRPNLLQALTRAPHSPHIPGQNLGNNQTTNPTSSTRLPDPELFPYLSRRLASTTLSTETNTELDDFSAANVMLALKHSTNPGSTLTGKNRNFGHIVTKSPSEDHTYSVGGVDVDEAFESDEEHSSPTTSYFLKHFTQKISKKEPKKEEKDKEEQRKCADALLNLAGIQTIHRKRSRYVTDQNAKRKHPEPEPEIRTVPFRPRLLRAKKRSDNQKRKCANINNNNNNNEWVSQR